MDITSSAPTSAWVADGVGAVKGEAGGTTWLLAAFTPGGGAAPTLLRAAEVPVELLRAAVAGGEIDARLFVPAGAGPWPVVVFFMDAFGLRPTLDAMGQRLADLGYAVVQPNLYWRGGPYSPFDPATTFADPAERQRVRALMDGFTKDQAVDDTRALLAVAGRDPRLRVDHIGLVGYCMGGRMAFVLAARLPEVAASASIHPGGLVTAEPDSPHLGAARIRGRVYLGIADQDNSCTEEHQAALRAALDPPGVRYQLEVQPGARHGYAVPDMPVFQTEAAERHWERLRDLFAAEL